MMIAQVEVTIGFFDAVFKAMHSVLTGLNTKCLKKGDPEPSPPPPGVARLYTMRFCPWAERVALTLAVKGIKSEVINIHLQEKPEWYFKKHPEGKVPVLEYDGEVTIESGLVPEYVENRFPESKRLFPGDAFGKFQQKLLVEQLMGVAPAYFGLAAALKDPSLTEEKNKAVKVVFEKAEGLLQGDFFGGSSIGYADILLFCFFERHYWASLLGMGPLSSKGFPGKEYPKLTKWFASMTSDPASAIQNPSVGAAFSENYAKGVVDYDAGL